MASGVFHGLKDFRTIVTVRKIFLRKIPLDQRVFSRKEETSGDFTTDEN